MKKEIIVKVAITIGVAFIMGVIMVFLTLEKEKHEIKRDMVIDEIKNIEEKSDESQEVVDIKEVENGESMMKDVSSENKVVKNKTNKKVLFLKTYCSFFQNGSECIKYNTDIYSFDSSDNRIEKIYEMGKITGYLFEPENKKAFFIIESGGVVELNLTELSLRSIMQRDYDSKVNDMLIEDDKLFYLSGNCGDGVGPDCILQYIDISNGFNNFIASSIKSKELVFGANGIITLGSYDKSENSLFFLNSGGDGGSSWGILYKVNIKTGDIKLIGKTGDDNYKELIDKNYSMELDDNYEYCDGLDLSVDLEKIAKISSNGADEGLYTSYYLLGCVE